MKITQEKQQFTPITLVIESLPELQAITYGVGMCNLSKIRDVANDRGTKNANCDAIDDASYKIFSELSNILKGLE